MLTTLAVLTRIFSNSTANLYQKKASKLSGATVTNLYSYLIMSVVCIVPACFVDWSVYPLEFWLNVAFAGLLCTIGTIALIDALKEGELSVLAPINSYKSIVGLLSAFLLLGEVPCLRDMVCILFIVLGSYFVLDTGGERFSLRTFFRRDVRLRIFALLCSGVEAAFLKKIILLSSYKISLILWCFSGFVCSVIIFGIKKNKKNLSQTNIIDCTMIAIMLLLMQLSTNYVFTKMEVGVALALFQLSSIVSLFFGYKFYKESEIPKKLLGTIIMIVSSAVVLIK